MGVITDNLKSATGLSSSGGTEWRDHIHQASFRGVPFGVIQGDGYFGRRVAIHEYPFRDTVWVEDLGRSARRFTLRGFLVQDSLVYSGGDVFAQRDALIAACESGESGLLVHPTLGEMTVYVPDGGLRIEEGTDSERVFVFSLAFVESGEKVFSIISSTSSTSSENWYQTLSTMASVTLAAITGEMNSVTGAVKTIRSTVSAYRTILNSAVDSVTEMTSTVSSLFSPDEYSRYCTGGASSPAGTTSSVFSSLATWLATTGADDDTVMDTIQACSVSDRADTEAAIDALADMSSVSDAVTAIQAVITTLAEATGSETEKIRVLAGIAVTEDGTYYTDVTAKSVSASVQTCLRALATGAMLWRLMQYSPRNLSEAKSMMKLARDVAGVVLSVLADRGDDEGYAALNAQYTQFISDWQAEYLSLSYWMTVRTRGPQPSLALANRLWQDASRADELVRMASPVHPAFMPVSFTARSS
ncbi:DNA circularization protein [Escherichia coli]|uniref:DNA circularization protein n=1 Tax=Escherichia coli TaxID=562 RepID=UPI001F0E9A18|nr:DNA circularization N-terminal domain-containing protein [Escherichia coli]UMR99562.1 multidrug DMT transporter permease [Escherichia coli]